MRSAGREAVVESVLRASYRADGHEHDAIVWCAVGAGLGVGVGE